MLHFQCHLKYYVAPLTIANWTAKTSIVNDNFLKTFNCTDEDDGVEVVGSEEVEAVGTELVEDVWVEVEESVGVKVEEFVEEVSVAVEDTVGVKVEDSVVTDEEEDSDVVVSVSRVVVSIHCK